LQETHVFDTKLKEVPEGHAHIEPSTTNGDEQLSQMLSERQLLQLDMLHATQVLFTKEKPL
jgi:hypothetical protein